MPTTLPSLIVPRANIAPRVTADNNDPAWGNAVETAPFSMSRGDEGKGLTPIQTTARILWTPDQLYIRYLCSGTYDYLPQKGRDAQLYRGDCVELFIDSDGDARDVIEMQVSGANDIFDQRITLDAAAQFDHDGLLTSELITHHRQTDIAWNAPGLRTAVAPMVRDGQGGGLDRRYRNPRGRGVENEAGSLFTDGKFARQFAPLRVADG